MAIWGLQIDDMGFGFGLGRGYESGNEWEEKRWQATRRVKNR